MPNKNSQLITDIEAKLLQIGSMAKIALDNHNYKLAGYDEPFIDNVDMGNLMWAIADMADVAYKEMCEIDFKEEPSHA